jgi:hypothetical protein
MEMLYKEDHYFNINNMKKFLLLFFFIINNFLFVYANINTIQDLDMAGSSGVSLYVKGSVKVKRANNDYWESVSLYEKFYPMDEIQTGENSVCEIKLFGDHILRLEPSSNFSFAERNPGIDKWTAFKLNAGKLWIKVIKGAPNADSFILDTPHASISIKGTFFSVEAPHGKVVVYEGEIEVRQQNRTISVQAGEQTNINRIGFMTNSEIIDEQGVSSFQELEKENTFFGKEGMQDIKNVIISKNSYLLPKNKVSENSSVYPVEDFVTKEILTSNLELPSAPFTIITDLQVTVSYLISENRRISVFDDSFLFKTPSLLSKLPVDKINSVYYYVEGESAIDKFNRNYQNPQYSNDPNLVNAGVNRNIEDYQLLGVRTIERDTVVGVSFKKQKYLQMLSSSNFNLIQNNILKFFFGKSFQLEKDNHIGLILRSAIINQVNNNTSSLNNQYEEIFQGANDNSGIYYGLDVGFSRQLLENFLLSITYKGLFANDQLEIEKINDNSLYFSCTYYDKYQISQISMKSLKSNNSLLFDSLFKLPQLDFLLFNVNFEFAKDHTIYSTIISAQTSDNFQLFFRYREENMKTISNSSIFAIGAQLDF